MEASPSATPIASDPPSLTLDDNFAASSDYSLDTMTPPLPENIYVMGQSPVVVSELCSPIDASYNAHDTLRHVQDQLSLIAANNVQLDEQSVLWGEQKANDDPFNMETDPSNFSNLMDLDALDFLKGSASERPKDVDMQTPSLGPSPPALDLDSYFLTHPNQVTSQAMMANSSPTSRCECYKSTLRMLLSLDETLPSPTSITLDTALKLDKEVLSHNNRVFQCSICAGSRSNQLLLQAILVDRIVGILESRSSSQNSTRCSSAQSSSTNLKRLTDSHKSHRLSASSGIVPQNETSILASTENCVLSVGSYEVQEDKNYFIKQLLQMRLMHLMGALRILQRATQSVLQDSSAKLAGMMLVETELRLRSVVGRVELWNV
jgi:hypothetical protein